MKRSLRQLSAVLVVLGLLASPAFAEKDGAGSRALSFLNVPVGARPGGMGTAYAALSEDAVGITYNPAGGAFVNRSEVAFQHNAYIEDMHNNYLAYLQPIGTTFTVGVFLQHQSSGDIPRTLVNTSGGGAVRIGDFDATDLVVGFHVSSRITREVSVGANFKYINSQIEEESGQAGAVDAGLRYDPRQFPRLRIGVGITNMGSSIKYIQEEEDLPLSWRVGAAYEFMPDKLLFTADYVGFADGDNELSLGGEYWPVSVLALRAGYTTQNDVTDGFTAGLGLRRDRISIDYAYMPFKDLGQSHRFSLNYRFGDERPEAPELNVRTPRVEGAPSSGSMDRQSQQQPQSSGRPRSPEGGTSVDAGGGMTVIVPPVEGAESSASSSAPAGRGTQGGASMPPSEERRSSFSRAESYRQESVTASTASEVSVNTALYDSIMRQGDQAFAAGDHPRALNKYRTAAAFNQDDPKVHYNIATCLYVLGDYRAASSEYRKAIALNGGDPNAALYLGFSEYQLNNTEEAIQAWRQTLQLDPENSVARANLEALGAL